jgi:hypothetical protein
LFSRKMRSLPDSKRSNFAVKNRVRRHGAKIRRATSLGNAGQGGSPQPIPSQLQFPTQPQRAQPMRRNLRLRSATASLNWYV